MIVDEADRDIDMAADPFLEAGIDIPKELPYQERRPTLKMKINGIAGSFRADNQGRYRIDSIYTCSRIE